MARILKKTSAFHFLDQSVERMERLNQQIPNKEALRLYRSVVKFAKLFDWKDPRGIPWSVILKKSARMEFENSKEEKDPVKLGQMLISGWEALMNAKQKYSRKEYDFIKHIDETRNRGRAPKSPPEGSKKKS